MILATKTLTTMVEFKDCTKQEYELINRIAHRAQEEIPSMKNRDLINIEMDITAVMVNVPIDLPRLLDADKFNFAHDICGIARYLNRKTGELENCFYPRITEDQ